MLVHRALTSTACLDEEHFRLVLQTWTVSIVKKSKNLLELPETNEGEGKLGGCETSSSPTRTNAAIT